jgi:PPOX class probable F420-dependent enzyme
VVEYVAVSELERLAAGRYLSLTTFKRDGTPVSTPVWLARDGDRLCVITEAGSGKAKRLRHTSRVELAPCTARGEETGPRAHGEAHLQDAAGTVRVRDVIAAQYGWQFRAFDLMGRLRRRGASGEQVGVVITVTEP